MELRRLIVLISLQISKGSRSELRPIAAIRRARSIRFLARIGIETWLGLRRGGCSAVRACWPPRACDLAVLCVFAALSLQCSPAFGAEVFQGLDIGFEDRLGVGEGGYSAVDAGFAEDM